MVRRARPVRERIVPVVVERLTREFEYPETDPGPQGVSILGAGGGAPTVVVAASDASELSKAKADYLCTGVNDEKIIQAAHDLLDISTGGRILLTEGTYQLTGGGVTISADKVTVQGMGKGTTTLLASFGSSTLITASGGEAIIKSIGFFGATNTAISLQGDRSIVTECFFQTLTESIELLAEHCLIAFNEEATGLSRFVHVPSGGRNGIRIIGNLISGAVILRASTDVVFADNDTLGGFSITSPGFGSNDVTVTGNNWYDSPTTPGGGPIIDLGDASKIVVSGNLISSAGGLVGISADGGGDLSIIGNQIIGAGIGISISNADGILLVGNTVQFTDEHGMAFTAMSEGLIANNRIHTPGEDADNTYDGIILAGDSDGNLVVGNKVVPGSFVSPRYGINISAGTCDDNAVVGNDFSDPGGTLYGTARFNDAGTGTVTAWAGTFGDNID